VFICQNVKGLGLVTNKFIFNHFLFFLPLSAIWAYWQRNTEKKNIYLKKQNNTLQAWQDVKRFCGSFAKISLLAPLSSNPDLPPALGKSLFIKWKEYGIYQFQHLFTICFLKSFSDLNSEFKIPNQEFYKYLQIHHLIPNFEKAGWLSLEWSKIEEILMNSTTLKGKISVIYCALLDHH